MLRRRIFGAGIVGGLLARIGAPALAWSEGGGAKLPRVDSAAIGPPASSGAAASRLRVLDAVSQFGADRTGASDCTAALQAALTAAADAVLVVPPGEYQINATLLISSGTTMRAHGARFFTKASVGFNLFNNVHFGAPYSAQKIDRAITIEGGTYDYGSLEDGNTHAISLRMASDIVVRDAVFLGGNDGTAMLACRRTRVENCRAIGQNNCAYDHWEGPQDAVVRGCHAFIRQANANGILFTGVGEPGTTLSASGARFEDNWICGSTTTPCGPAILMNADGPGCATENAKVLRNHLINTGGGVVITGAGGRHEASENWFIECGASTARGGDCLVRISPEKYGGTTYGPPSDCVIGDNHAIGCRVDGAIGVALMQLDGTGHFVGPLDLRRTAIAGGIVFWCPTASNGIVIRGPVTADRATISGVTYGLLMGDKGTVIETVDPWKRPVEAR